MRRVLWVIGPVVLVGVLAFVVLATRGPAASTAFTLKVADCFDIPGDAQIGDLATIDCSRAHDAEVFQTGTVPYTAPTVLPSANPDPYPGTSVIATWVGTHCGPDVIRAYAGQSSSATLSVGYFFPDENAWSRGERQVTCYLHTRDGSKLTSPLRAASSSAAPS